MINTLHKDHLKKLIAMFLSINSALPMAKPSAKLFIKILKQK